MRGERWHEPETSHLPPSFRAEWTRRPGIQAEVVDSRFRGNDGGEMRGERCHEPETSLLPPSFRAE